MKSTKRRFSLASAFSLFWAEKRAKADVPSDGQVMRIKARFLHKPVVGLPVDLSMEASMDLILLASLSVGNRRRKEKNT